MKKNETRAGRTKPQKSLLDPHDFWYTIGQLIRCAIGYEEAHRGGTAHSDPRVLNLINKIHDDVDKLMWRSPRGFSGHGKKMSRVRHLEFIYNEYDQALKGKRKQEEMRAAIFAHFHGSRWPKLMEKEYPSKDIERWLIASPAELRKTGLTPGSKSDPGKKLGPLEIACERLGGFLGLSKDQLLKDWSQRARWKFDFYDGDGTVDFDPSVFEGKLVRRLIAINEPDIQNAIIDFLKRPERGWR
jgi:hypothetical protein